jgi:hypothetical protein
MILDVLLMGLQIFYYLLILLHMMEYIYITYIKGHRGRIETFHPSIHPWHHTRKKTLAKMNKPRPPPLSAHLSLSRKGMPHP